MITIVTADRGDVDGVDIPDPEGDDRLDDGELDMGGADMPVDGPWDGVALAEFDAWPDDAS